MTTTESSKFKVQSSKFADIGDDARVFVAAIAFRLFSALIAFLANVTFPPFQDQRFTVFRAPHLFWDTFARWDSGWYHGIAAYGYVYGEGGRNNLAFFPVYPLLMRAGGRVLGGHQESYYIAGVMISWLAFAFAMMLLFKLARLDLDRGGALRAVCYAALFPSAYFFGMVYSESVFLLALVGSVYAFRRHDWMIGALSGAVMTATRVTGVTMVPGLVWIAWRAATTDPRTRLRAMVAAVATTGGMIAYSIFTYIESGRPFAWYEAITYWGYKPGGESPLNVLNLLAALATRPYQFLALEDAAPYNTLNVLAALAALGLVPLIWRRFGVGYVLVVLGGVLLPLSSGEFEGLGRYCSVLFPLPIALASLKADARHQIILTAFAMLYAICLALFVTVHPLF